ncbi:hypothetical protein OPV22_004022 [Ensete ventricosum]|uniref:Uncharacterized protein n=1 Tax=Ensete ventricosum TaxID=4639 RepID=A0AAV8S283_ENSVE|nr:hypothetical protein OPV22_004022 [Ensete ventricosum]
MPHLPLLRGSHCSAKKRQPQRGRKRKGGVLLRIRVGLASLCFVFGFYRQCGSGGGFCFGVPRWDALKWARAAREDFYSFEENVLGVRGIVYAAAAVGSVTPLFITSGVLLWVYTVPSPQGLELQGGGFYCVLPISDV